MIKVCHLTSVHPSKDGRIFYKECCSLANAGYNVTLVAAGAHDEVCNNVNIIGIPITSRGRLGRMFKTGRAVYKKALEVNADIYHFHDPELLPYGLKLKQNGKKVIFDSHEFVAEQIRTKPYIPKIIRKPLSSLYKIFETYICNRLDAVIEVCTIDGKDYFENRCGKSVFIANDPIINDQVIVNHKSDGNLCKVVHVGSLTYERGITYLAEAIKETSGTLILAGRFASDMYKEEIEEICEDKLDYRGMLSIEEIPQLLNECGIGTCTLLDVGQYSHIDVLPTKIYEYMLASKPIVMSKFPYLVEFNNKYNIGICVDPANPKAIADALEYLITHPTQSKEMGENGHKAIISKFNWKIQEVKLLNLYKELLESYS